jgi:hypothetical protein
MSDQRGADGAGGDWRCRWSISCSDYSADLAGIRYVASAKVIIFWFSSVGVATEH